MTEKLRTSPLRKTNSPGSKQRKYVVGGPVPQQVKIMQTYAAGESVHRVARTEERSSLKYRDIQRASKRLCSFHMRLALSATPPCVKPAVACVTSIRNPSENAQQTLKESATAGPPYFLASATWTRVAHRDPIPILPRNS